MRNLHWSFIIFAFTRLYGVKVLLVYSWNLLKLMPERMVWILFVSMPTCTILQRFPRIGQSGILSQQRLYFRGKVCTSFALRSRLNLMPRNKARHHRALLALDSQAAAQFTCRYR